MSSASSAIAIALADVAVILIVRACLVGPARRLRQPVVIAEILAGIVLGPSVLGLLPGNLPGRIFPVEARPLLAAIAEVGLVLFMFLVGWQLEIGLAWRRRGAVASISIASMAVPFGAGVFLAAVIWSQHAVVDGHPVDRLSFVLFLGVAMSITAFPVLARIIVEHGLQTSRVGALALACAAAADVLAWSALAVVSAIVASTGPAGFVRVVACTACYAAVLAAVVRPMLRRLLALLSTSERGASFLLSIVAAGTFASADVASRIGLDAIFGAFAFGMVMPRDLRGDVAKTLTAALEQITGLLMPIFFIVTGLSIDVTKLGTAGFIDLAAVLAVACAGKFIGTVAPARLCRLPFRESMLLGVLMNTRGLTELVILNVGLSLGILDTRMFTVMVLMAVVTTGMAGPLLYWVLPHRRAAQPPPAVVEGGEPIEEPAPDLVGADAEPS